MKNGNNLYIYYLDLFSSLKISTIFLKNVRYISKTKKKFLIYTKIFKEKMTLTKLNYFFLFF